MHGIGEDVVIAPQSDDLILDKLKELNSVFGEYLKADGLIIRAPIGLGLDDFIRKEVEGLYGPGEKRPSSLAVILETTGGYIEVVERIYNVFRKHYDHVSFIVPNYAYSAGTVLVLSGDDIYMDYYSVLGPIDPQMANDNDRFVSGLGYLTKYNELVATINAAGSPESVRAELAYLLKKFDPAELFDLEQARSHSEDLLVAWLSQHKFKNWTTTETKNHAVTDDDRKARAKEIAGILGDPERWHSHGRGIGMRELTSEEIKLKINDFGADPELNKCVRNYYGLFMDYCTKIGASGSGASVLHSRNSLRRM